MKANCLSDVTNVAALSLPRLEHKPLRRRITGRRLSKKKIFAKIKTPKRRSFSPRVSLDRPDTPPAVLERPAPQLLGEEVKPKKKKLPFVVAFSLFVVILWAAVLGTTRPAAPLPLFDEKKENYEHPINTVEKNEDERQLPPRMRSSSKRMSLRQIHALCAAPHPIG